MRLMDCIRHYITLTVSLHVECTHTNMHYQGDMLKISIKNLSFIQRPVYRPVMGALGTAYRFMSVSTQPVGLLEFAEHFTSYSILLFLFNVAASARKKSKWNFKWI